MEILLTELLVFLLLFRYYQAVNNFYFGPVSFLIAIYTLMAAASILTYALDITPSALDLEITPILYLVSLLILPIYAFSIFKDRQLAEIRINNYPLFDTIGSLLIIVSSISWLYFFPNAIKALSGHLGDNRAAMVYGTERLAFLDFGILNSFMTISANLFILNFIWGYIYLTESLQKKKSSTIKAIVLFLTSTSYAMNVFAFVGRDGFVLWVFSLVAVHLLLSGFISRNTKTSLQKIFLIVSGALAVPFWMITEGRFADSSAGLFGSLITYIGGQPQMFSDYYQTLGNLQFGKMNFPIFCDLYNNLAGEVMCEYDRWEHANHYIDSGVLPWSFATYIGAWLFDFGKTGTIILVILYSLAIRQTLNTIRQTRFITLSGLIIFFVLLNIALWGVFYFKQAVLNYSILSYLLVSMAFYLGGSRAAIIVPRVTEG